MILLKILLIVGVAIIGIQVLLFIGICIYALSRLIPVIRKEALLRNYGYEWDQKSDYWENKDLDVSIPYNWFLSMSYQDLQNYLERRASH